jgi:transcriptional regulator of heat shock response
MEDRLKKLMALVVEDVIETGEPVGSQHLVETYGLDVSPATIRNWLVELEGEGCIMQPHTSSGRVPTERGYRLYVEEIMQPRQLSKRESQELDRALAMPTDDQRRSKSLAKAAAELSGAAVIVGLDEADTFYTGLSQLFAQPEFRDWNRMVSIGQVLDRLDEVLQLVRKRTFRNPTILIGKECPFGNACSSLLLTTNDGTLFGVLGPLRMDYRKCLAILGEIQRRMS